MSYAITILTHCVWCNVLISDLFQQHNISIHINNRINLYWSPASYKRLTVFHVSIIEKELIYIGVRKDTRKKVIYQLDEITEILHQYHSNPMDGHSGINNTLAKVSKFYTWNGMREDVIEYVNRFCIK